MTQPTGFGLLSVLMGIPLLGAILVAMIPEQYSKAIKSVSLVISLAAFAVSLVVVGKFQSGTYHFQLVEFVPWIDKLGVHYRVGVDGV
ncbi:MAG: hypothetical protein JNM34_03435, partial [Chthonomonadaceae bacterium]|nr:hypothetical protein [Chthonomonadaceae bacterium]